MPKKQLKTYDDLVDPFGAAKILGVSVSRLKQLAHEGKIVPIATLSIGRIYRRRDIEAYAAQRSRTAA